MAGQPDLATIPQLDYRAVLHRVCLGDALAGRAGQRATHLRFRNIPYTLTAFFMAEMGDKTQFATVALAARYDSLYAVILGTTLGMMLANAPAVWIGKALAGRIDMRKVRWLAATLFLLMGIGTLASGTTFG